MGSQVPDSIIQLPGSIMASRMILPALLFLVVGLVSSDSSSVSYTSDGCRLIWVNEQKCDDGYDLQCQDELEDRCETVDNEVCKTDNERQCKTEYDERCDTGYREDCKTEYNKKCSTSYEKECR